MAVSKVLRKRSRPYYKEPSLADIYVIDFKRAKQHTEEEDTNISTAIAKHAVQVFRKLFSFTFLWTLRDLLRIRE